MSEPLTTRQPAQMGWLDKALPLLGIALITGGFVLLVWFTWLWLTPGTSPYRYELVESGDSSQFPQLELDAWPDLAIEQYEVRVPAIDQVVARAYFGRRNQQAPVLLDWQNLTSEPLLMLDRKPAELSALATAIDKHAPKDALILAWWDTSAQLALLTQRDVLFRSPLHEPLIIPDDWQAQRAAILAYEQRHAGITVNEAERSRFQRFTHALTQSREAGLAELRELTGSSRETYLVVHVTDLYKLGLMYPEKMGVAFKNYRMTGNIHGMISHLKTEMGRRGYHAYTLQSLSDELIRAFFLTDEASYQTLIAPLLPLTNHPPPLELETPKLVYQQGGYWVYKLTETGQ